MKPSRTRRVFSTLWRSAVAGALATPAAALSIDADFDHGSLLAWSGTTSSISLTGRDNFYGGGTWRWLYFEASGVLGATPTFTISSNFALGRSNLDEHRMMFSHDNENWEFFDQNARSGSSYTFGNDTPFAEDRVWVAYAQPYSYGRSQTHTAAVLSTPWAAPTASADANGVIGMSPGGVDDLGRSIAPRPLYGYRITDPSTDSPTEAKRKVVLTGGLHAGEVLGSHTLEGLVDWLVSDDPLAGELRRVAEFFVYPVLNPDGRFAGYARGTVENPFEDPNRLWHPDLWADHEDIRVSGEAMLADVASTPGNRVEAFLDFHSTVPAPPNEDFAFIERDQLDHLTEWWLRFRDQQPQVFEVDSTSSSWTTANFADALLNAEVDVTFETQHGKNRPVSYYRELGKSFGIAFGQTYTGPPFLAGDYNEDGVVDAADYTVWRDTFADNTPFKPADGNGNGFVALDDLQIWRTAYGESVLGDGAPAPEPASSALLTAAAAALWLRRVR